MADISISSAIRSNLLSLQGTSDLMAQTRGRLSSGKRVASAVDDPVAYFQAKSLTDRASDLKAVKDNITQGVKTLETAVKALEGAEKLIKQMKGLAVSAQAESDATKRGKLADQFDDLKDQLDDLVRDAQYQGVNLIDQSGTFTQELKVTLNEDTTNVSEISISAKSSTSAGLSITTATGSWATTANAEDDVDTINEALVTLRENMQELGNNLAFLKIREEFTSTLVNNLDDGASKLVEADMNTEAANMLTLQTRQQMGTNALSMANQAEQSILQLFR